MGNVHNRLMLCKTLIARALTSFKMFVRHLALKKLWSTILPVERMGGIPYLTRGLQSVSQVDGVNSYSKTIKEIQQKVVLMHYGSNKLHLY